MADASADDPVRQLGEAGRLAAEGRLAAALEIYDRTIAAHPALPEAHFNRAIVLQRQRRFDDAERGFMAALGLRPQWPDAFLALGRLAFHHTRYADAEAWFQRAADLDPKSVEAVCNLGIAQSRQMHPKRALAALRQARQMAPQHEVPWFELRRALNMLGRSEEAHEDFLRYEASASPSARLACTGLGVARHVAGQDFEQRYLPMALAWPYTVADLETLSDLLALLPYYDIPPERVVTLYQTYDRLAQTSRAGVADVTGQPAAPDGRLSIGLLSADLRTHVMGRIIEELCARHDPASFDIRLYSLMPLGGDDALTARLRPHVRGITGLAGLTDYEAAAAIAADRLHILVDLMGHTVWAQPGILLFKPAPVIVTHLGYHGAIGLRQVDFKITDRVADLSDARDFQIERPLAMSSSIIPIRRVAVVQPLPRVASGPTFGAFVSLQKMSPRCIKTWARILERVPDGTLVFSPQRMHERKTYLLRADSFGIDPERIRFVPMTLDEPTDRGRYAAIDVALDAFPYTGGDSAACALAERVPFVTLCGRRHGERVATSVLTHLGITDTVAQTEHDYVEIAVRLAIDPSWRRQLANRIAAALPEHDAAMDAYARSLEAALQEAWRWHERQTSGTPPALSSSALV
jgi:predicted O-linked N-acetylglucosamine transferase (SPINDLY family)